LKKVYITTANKGGIIEMRKIAVVSIVVTVILIGGCATTKQKEMIWVSASKLGSDQDSIQCKQDAAVASGVFSTAGNIQTTNVRRSNYEAILSECMRSKGYVLEDKELYLQKKKEIEEISRKRGLRIGILLPQADNVEAKIFKISEGSPAEKAGLKVGDIIKEVNNTEISSALQLLRCDCDLKAGGQAKFVVFRDGFTKTFVLIPEKK
jgi:S1-C subfamily serine protease